MGIESVGPKNVVTPGPVAATPVVKPEPLPGMTLDSFNFKLPPSQPKLKLDLQEHDEHGEPRPFMDPKTFEKGAFKVPRLGISQDVAGGFKLDADVSLKHGGGLKLKLHKSF
ncbi:MAG: hypothetical protein JWM80_3597 [Cyanobacteria bacterium RYN_339]|nr:hypothetical protein [Cyanobacteria bacterium RYN_339]